MHLLIIGDPKTLDSSANDTPNKDTPPIKEKKGTSEDIHKEIDELRRNTQIYFRRFKKVCGNDFIRGKIDSDF